MSDWRVRVNNEGESPLHDCWGKGESLNMGADCWRLGIGAGMAIFEATDNRHRNNQWAVLEKSWVCKAKAW